MKSNVLKLNNGFKLSLIVVPHLSHTHIVFEIKGTMSDEKNLGKSSNSICCSRLK